MPWIYLDGGRVELTEGEYDRLKYARLHGETMGETWKRVGSVISYHARCERVATARRNLPSLPREATATPLTDLEHRWFTDDELALRREVGPPKERSLVESLGIAAVCLVGGTCCMVMVAFVGYGLFDLLRWVIAS